MRALEFLSPIKNLSLISSSVIDGKLSLVVMKTNPVSGNRDNILLLEETN